MEGQSIVLEEKYDSGWISEGTHFEQPASPHPNHIFNWTTKQWLDPRTLDQIKAAQWVKIQVVREGRAMSGGWIAAGKWFHSDLSSISKQLGLVRKADRVAATGGDMTAGFAGAGPGGKLYWKTMDGSFVLMTAALAIAIFDASEHTQGLLFARAEQHKAAMQAAPDPEAYDYTVGWPLTYGDTL